MEKYLKSYQPVYQETFQKFKINPIEVSINRLSDFHSKLIESVYNLRKITTELDKHISLPTIFFDILSIKDDRIIDREMKSFMGFVQRLASGDSIYYIYDISYLLPLLNEQAKVESDIIDELQLYINIGLSDSERGGVSSGYDDGKGIFRIYLSINSENTQINSILSTLSHELTHTIDFIRSKGRTQYRGKEDWRQSELLKRLQELDRILDSNSFKPKEDYISILNSMFLSPTEMNARVQEAKRWVDENGKKLDKYSIYEINSISSIELFYADIQRDRKLPLIDKQEIGVLINIFFIELKKRLVRENLYHS